MPKTQAKTPETEAQWEEWLRPIVGKYPSYLSDDLMQEARIALWLARKRYAVEGRAQYTTILYKSVAWRLLKFLIGKTKTIHVPESAHEKGVRIVCISNVQAGFSDFYDQMPPWESSGTSLENACILRMQVQSVMAKMTPRQRVVVRMVAGGYCHSEVGRFFGIARKSASCGYHDAEKKMRRLLEQKGVHA